MFDLPMYRIHLRTCEVSNRFCDLSNSCSLYASISRATVLIPFAFAAALMWVPFFLATASGGRSGPCFAVFDDMPPCSRRDPDGRMGGGGGVRVITSCPRERAEANRERPANGDS